jgi:hypothetical protein
MEDPMDRVSSPTINGSRIANTIHLPGHDGSRIAYKVYGSPERESSRFVDPCALERGG